MSEASETNDVEVAPGLFVHTSTFGPTDAPLLVVLPPLGGSAELFEPFRDALARDLRVLVCEPPGCGDASPPRGIPSTRSLARDVIVALEAAEVSAAALFGISLGGMIAQWVALDAPSLVRRLLLASTAARGIAALGSDAAKKLALARCLLSSEPSASLALEIASEPMTEDDRDRLEHAALAHPRTRADLAWLAAAAAAHDTTERVARIGVPTLVLSGDADPIMPLEAQRALATAIPHARHTIVAAAGHDLTLDRAEETAALVRDFALP